MYIITGILLRPTRINFWPKSVITYSEPDRFFAAAANREIYTIVGRLGEWTW
jgi:hypothetical protein